MSAADKLIADPPKAFLTDVFGTVVNWRKTVVDCLESRAHDALNSAARSIPTTVREVIDTVSWPAFAQKWRKSYYEFTRHYDPHTMRFKTIDEHHLESLHALINEHMLQGLWTDEEISEIAMVWHRLEPWSDSSAGLRKLSEKFITATLSNGNRQLLADLSRHGNLSYTHIISAEDFGAYKPNPAVYLGAVQLLPDCRPSDCCLVAAHLGDLWAAKNCGFKTVYIERSGEEEWPQPRIQQAKEEGFVDMWIKVNEQGFITLANKFDS